jgi:hypothetical protein
MTESVRQRPSGNARGGGVDRGSYGAVARDRRVAGERSSLLVGRWRAHGTRGAIGASRTRLRGALLTEIAPAVDTSTARSAPQLVRRAVRVPAASADDRAPAEAARSSTRACAARDQTETVPGQPTCRPASRGGGGGRWRARRRVRSRSGAPIAGLPRRAGSRRECHAPSSADRPMTGAGPRCADHARRLRRTRRRALHRPRFPQVAGAAVGAVPPTRTIRAPAQDRTSPPRQTQRRSFVHAAWAARNQIETLPATGTGAGAAKRRSNNRAPRL